MGLSFFKGGGVTELRTVEDIREGGVKKLEKSGDIFYGRPLSLLIGSNFYELTNFCKILC